MRQRRFVQVDVFSPEPTRGNGLAVVVDAEGLSDEQMQQFANWTNLAETSFLLPPTTPDADYRLRIFTPSREMPFAGHPTLGSCAAWLHCGGEPRHTDHVVQECGVGLVEIDRGGERLAFAAPPTACAALPGEDEWRLIEALQIDPATVVRSAFLDNGPRWQVLELDSAGAVLGVDATLVKWPDFTPIGLIGRHSDGVDCDCEVRMLAPSSGMLEDPITGSLNSAIACWMAEEGRLDRELVIAQGTVIGRFGRVYVRAEGDGRILIGGDVQVLIDGELRL